MKAPVFLEKKSRVSGDLYGLVIKRALINCSKQKLLNV